MAASPDKPQATITAIARAAGVSHATVSLVLNDRVAQMRVNAQTAQRVRQIAREMNYSPNPLARGLRGKQTRTVGVLWSLCGPHPSEASTRRITLLTQQRGYSAFVADSLSDPQVVRTALAEFAQRRADGVIFQVGNAQLMQDSAIQQMLEPFKAVVLVSREPVASKHDLVYHCTDEAYAEVVRHLAADGRRRLAIFADGASGQNKLASVRSCMQQQGYGDDELLHLDFRFVPGQTTPQEIHATLAAAAEGGRRYDALLCGTDELAAAAMHWHQAQGRRVPQDVAIVGFNDHSLSQFLQPPLASVRRHDDTVAQVAVELLLNRLENPAVSPRQQTVQMQFIARASAGAVNQSSNDGALT